MNRQVSASRQILSQQPVELEARLSSAPPPAPILHPNLAQLYQRKVQNLHASLNNPDCRTEAAEIIRSLVESIKVRNHDDGLEIELVGEIANMIEAAQTANLKAKAASEEAASLNNYRSSVKLVAGVGFEPTTFRL